MDTRLLRRHIAFSSGLLAVLALSLTACANATMVPVQGPAPDIAALAGDWNGTYTSPDLSRKGTIWFRLVDGEDHAHGDVRMTPHGSSIPYGHEYPVVQPPEPVQFLGIRFVRISATSVSGVLDRYWDPDAGCFANTTFRGWVGHDRIEGTFETRLATGVVAVGRWQVARRPARQDSWR